MQIDESTLARYYSNELRQDERSAVDYWIAESEENKQTALAIYYILLASDTDKINKQNHTLDALKSVKRRIRRRRLGTFYLWTQRVAAILFIPLLIGTLLYLSHQDPIQYMEVHASPGMVCSVDLPDGSKVWLNSDSYLKYPTVFKGDNRDVYLNGEAYFSVQKDKRRFVVNADNHLSVEVYGTEFNVDAYSKSHFISTTLFSGSVKLVYTDDQNIARVVDLQPAQKMVFTKETKKLYHKDTYCPTDMSWKEGKIVLRDTPLEDVLWMLTKRFNVNFTVQNPLFNDYSFTGTFNDQQLSVILDHFTISSKIRYKIEIPKTSENNEIESTRITLY